MNLRQLEYLKYIAEYKSISKAAKALHVAQPAVSMAVKQLEDHLGLTLLKREKKHIELTHEGENILCHINKIFDQINSLYNEVDDLKSITKGEVKLGIPEMIGNTYFTNMLIDFKTSYPSLHMTVDAAPAQRIHTKLINNDIDLAIVAIDSLTDEFDFIELFEEELLICTSSKNELRRYKDLTLSQLKNENWVLFGEENYHQRKMFMSLLKKEDITPEIVFEGNLIDTVKQLIKNNIGISLLHKHMISPHDDILGIPLKPKVNIKIGIAWKKNGYISKANKLFIDFIHKKSGAFKTPPVA